MKETTILHLSDLHFGQWFQTHKWEEIKVEAKKIQPDVVIITGDLVNTPWFWKLRKAKAELEKFLGEIKPRADAAEAKLFIVPGNHDTRVSGLFAIKWLKYAFFISFAIGVLMLACSHQSPVSWLSLRAYSVTAIIAAGICASVALVSMVLRMLTSTRLDAVLSPFLVRDVQILADMGLGVLPLDSATASKLGAHGRVPNDVAVKCQKVEENAQLFWIAAVHHHALPLPYDSEHESLMIMENAGTLLQELLKRKVPLILHGHKHHHHFARLSTRTKDGEDREIAVLSAATPTEKYNQGAFHHGYNVLRLANSHELTITTFEAEAGGSFNRKNTINITTDAEYARRRFEGNSKELGLSCAKMVSSVQIDEYGDALLSREFAGLETQAILTEFPCELAASSVSGEITHASVQVTSDKSPSASLEIVDLQSRSAKFKVQFSGDVLRPNSFPLDLNFRALATNAFALTSTQHRLMQPHARSTDEEMIFTVPDCLAVRELILLLSFPKTAAFPKSISLQVSTPEVSRNGQWHPVDSQSVTYSHSTQSVIAQIASPQPGARYRFYWHVGQAQSVPVGKLQSRMTGLTAKRGQQQLAEAIKKIFEFAVDLLGTQSLKEEDDSVSNINVTVFRFNHDTAQLAPVVTTLRSSTSAFNYPYGIGLPGRAFKIGKVTVYDRSDAKTQQLAESERSGHSINIKDIPAIHGKMSSEVQGTRTTVVRPGDPTSTVGTAIAFPIFESGATNRQPFCVVEVSVKGEGGQLKLSDTQDDRAHSNFQQEAFRILQAALNTSTMASSKKGANHGTSRR
ncbi:MULTISPECIES: metallophosphoesterase family protein [Paraburkholderia]|uniref:metallophosphoesterase family protein n=1 Tax=Paraburkholderia TaxID=1822464 RepID=UPI0022548916|nr:MULTISPECIES: metallophosphoesterase [Paraburkholderia]MCX4156300.1 metallophosphoesterase [Paraburkholderia aspalathi]MDN7165705.1 metallophosphoesterase [Paraburkholderia sp. SECH2]MDQ6394191.1 metallophosphoesterase [Paraburkholderia aspalathi]